MVRAASMVATVALLLSADTSGVLRTSSPSPPASFPAVQSPQSPQNPSRKSGKSEPSKSGASEDSADPAKAPAGTLQPDSRLTLVRFVDGEVVRVVSAIPAGKKGMHIKAGVATDEKTVRMALASSSGAINPGDHAQITDLQFKDKQIIVDINGGGRGKTRLRDHIHLEVGGGLPTMTTSTTSTQDTPLNTTPGATIYLDFDKPVPDLTPEQLEKYLSGFLDFSKRHSAAVQWVESLPPEIQKAIQDKQPVVGMDHDMVLAAMGRPDRKVREKDAEGNEIEDWIYGTPPEKTIFVSFEGDKVKEIHQYPQ